MKILKFKNQFFNFDYFVSAEIHENQTVTVTFTKTSFVVNSKEWALILEKAQIKIVDVK